MTQPSYQKLRGGYYTPGPIASFLASWAIRSPADKILEPSCGDGNILTAAARRLMGLGAASDTLNQQLHSVELDPQEAAKASQRLHDLGLPLSTNNTIHVGDFFEHCQRHLFGEQVLTLVLKERQRFDVVIGNPPFIRYQHFPEEHRQIAFSMMQQAGLHPNRLTNAWLPFLVVGSLLLKEDGRLAMVIPAELFQVNYAAEVRQFLSDYFSKVTLLTFQQLVFKDIQQEVVLLLAECNHTSNSGIRTVELADIKSLDTLTSAKLDAAELKPMDHSTEKWTQYFLDPAEIHLLREMRKHPGVTPANSYVFDVFRVAGGSLHQYCFNTDTGDFELFGLTTEPAADNIKWLANLREARPAGPWSATWNKDGVRMELWMPSPIDRLLVADAPGWRSYKGSELHAPPITEILAERAGEDLSSTFAAVMSPYKGEVGPVADVQQIVPEDAEGTAVALVVQLDGRTDYIISSLDDEPRSYGPIELAGRFGFVSLDADGAVRAAALMDGTLLRCGDTSLKLDQPRLTRSVVTIEGRTITLDEPLPDGDDLAGTYLLAGDTGYEIESVEGARITVREYEVQPCEEIVIPLVMGAVGTAANAFGLTIPGLGGGTAGGGGGLFGMPSFMTSWGDMSMALGDAFSGLGMYGTADFLGSLSPGMLNMGAGLLAGLPALLSGNYASAGLTTAGSIIGGLTPLGPLGAGIGGMIGHLVGGLLGGHSYTPYINEVARMGRDSSGRLVGIPASWPADDPGHERGDFEGSYVWSKLHGGDINEASKAVDDAFTAAINAYADRINATSSALPDAIATVFDTLIDQAITGPLYESHANVSHVQEHFENVMEALQKNLGDAFDTLLEQFGALATAINDVEPAFDQLLGTLAQATSNYFDPLLGIDQAILDAGGQDYLFSDMVDRADTYKLLFDNAVANGLPGAFQLGQQYANSLVQLAPLTDNLDLAGELETIRQQMLDIAGSPEDFQASVLQTLQDFKAGVEESINSITRAITELHPEINLDVDVDVHVTDTEASVDAIVDRAAV